MRDVLAKHNYKFPNISMFSTRTQATKDRRRAGFDELLKLLTIPGYVHLLTHLLTHLLSYSLTQLDNMFVKKSVYF